MVVHSTDAAESATVQWSGLQNTLEYAESDVLTLLDCCAAASSVAGAGSGVTEVIAACGFETWAPLVGEHSFTRSLIDELRYWSYGPPLSVAMLHNKVLSRIKYWKPRFGASGDHERRKTPIYMILANEGKQRSIELKPLPSQFDLAAELPSSLTQVSSSNSSTYPELPGSDNEIAPDSSHSDLENQCSPKVLISVALEEDQWLLTSAWADWLRSIPAIVKDAHVEGVLKSNSVLILMSISVAVWNLLPKDPAITFVGFVKSWGLFNDKPLPRPAEGFKGKDKNSLGSMRSAKDDRRASLPLHDKVDDDESIEWINSSKWADWLDATPGLVKFAYLETAYEENPLKKSKAEKIRFVLSETYEDRQ
ncbi:hypothetical protein OEA41_010680 [Lepraria neglecta]|uniref:Uncharacterized protein n=1 Tax=Lepraria neglecta TaxID=209136 RepID=A0AAD9YZF0_9LECA|nr:hypothetical protein OEA41_010680 [Lepraria neglecta]